MLYYLSKNSECTRSKACPAHFMADMDPYLEEQSLWPDVRQRLMTYIVQKRYSHLSGPNGAC